MTRHRIGGSGRIRRVGGRKTAAGAAVAVPVALLLLAGPAGATSGTGSTQTVSFTPSAQLSIAASPVSIGSITPSSSVPVGLGSVLITDTLDDSVDWSASVAASDCFLPTSGLPAGLQTANATIPATALTYVAPSGPVAAAVPLSATEVTASGGGTSTFGAAAPGGSLAAPTFGSPVPVAATTAYASASPPASGLDNDGTWAVTPAVNLNLSSTGFVPINNVYTCTLQYTIVG
jgi:hypothetical protein